MGLRVFEKGDVVYYPHPMMMVKNDKPMTVKDRYIRVYPSRKFYIRYLYDNLLERLAQEMHENIEGDFDNVVCIWGAEGSGKSVLAYWLAKTYDPDFDMAKSYVYSFDDLLNKIHDSDADEGSIFWLDEATNISNNRDWMIRDNKTFIKMLEMFRSRKWTLILCIPDFNRLDIYLREQRIRFSLHAEILSWEGAPEKSRGYFELRRMDVASSRRREQVVGFGKFPDIPAEDRAAYAAIKKNTQDTMLQEMYDKKNGGGKDGKGGKALRMLILEMRENGMSVADIAAKTDLAEQTVMNYCRLARRERGDADED